MGDIDQPLDGSRSLVGDAGDVRVVGEEPCARFLFVTGNGDDPRTNDFLQKADGLVVFKPVPSDELLQMISLVLQRNARQQQ